MILGNQSNLTKKLTLTSNNWHWWSL